MKLVDSSSWVHGLRRGGKPEIADRVRRLVESGEAAWCPAIRLELWNGVGGDADRRILRDFEQTLPELALPTMSGLGLAPWPAAAARPGRPLPPSTSSSPRAPDITASRWSTTTATSTSS